MAVTESILTEKSLAQPARRASCGGGLTLRMLLGGALLALTTALGIAAFLYPFWAPGLARAAGGGSDLAHSSDAPLVLTAIVLLAFAVLLVEVQAQAVSAKAIALLGVLVALNSVLRFAEVALPGPGGFSPIFVLIVTGGYVFGARIGFLLGALTLVASALMTGGVGPWLPYQMLTAGWVGMSAPLCRPVVHTAQKVALRWAPRLSAEVIEVGVLALFGGLWGIIFGLVMNIWFWPFAAGPASMSWEAGEGVLSALRSYAVFYVVTSLVWDLLRAAGNLILIGLVGAAVLRILRRFEQRFDFTYLPQPVLPQPVLPPALPSAQATRRSQ